MKKCPICEQEKVDVHFTWDYMINNEVGLCIKVCGECINELTKGRQDEKRMES